MRVFALRCPWLHSNRPVVALPLRWCRQHPISVVEKEVVEPMAEAVSAPLPISMESIRLSFFRKSTRKNWRKEKTATHVNYINGNLMVCDCIDKNFNKRITKTFVKLQLDMEANDAIEYDDDGGHNDQSRKRKEPDSGRDENSNSLNLANAQRVETKPVYPSLLFTSQRLQASYQNLDTIFDNYYYTLPYNNFVLSLLDISRLPFQRGRLNLKYYLFSLID